MMLSKHYGKATKKNTPRWYSEPLSISAWLVNYQWKATMDKYKEALCSKCTMPIMVLAHDMSAGFYCQQCAWDKVGGVGLSYGVSVSK
jgi:hypothetical protein